MGVPKFLSCTLPWHPGLFLPFFLILFVLAHAPLQVPPFFHDSTPTPCDDNPFSRSHPLDRDLFTPFPSTSTCGTFLFRKPGVTDPPPNRPPGRPNNFCFCFPPYHRGFRNLLWNRSPNPWREVGGKIMPELLSFRTFPALSLFLLERTLLFGS